MGWDVILSTVILHLAVEIKIYMGSAEFQEWFIPFYNDLFRRFCIKGRRIFRKMPKRFRESSLCKSIYWQLVRFVFIFLFELLVCIVHVMVFPLLLSCVICILWGYENNNFVEEKISNLSVPAILLYGVQIFLLVL